MELQEKYENHREDCIEKSINSRLKATVDIEILIRTRKGGIKIMQPARITSGPAKSMRK